MTADAARGIVKPAWLSWVVLALILAGYVAAVVHLHPTNFFGATEDDSIYFSSAKALAQGQGYVLPSVPGTPPATKYPILYPLILSVVWRLNPSFPANLSWAIAVTIVFGLGYLTTGFIFLRRLKMLHDAEALLLTAMLAFHPVVLFYCGSILSDIPFAALALLIVILSDNVVEPDGRAKLALLCGVIAGLSMLMRIFGMTIVAGILVAAMLRHAWKKMLIFAAGVLPFFLIMVGRALSVGVVASPVSESSASAFGWVNSWLYVTSYVGMWKVGVPNVHTFWIMTSDNLGALVIGPADLFLSPLLVGQAAFARTFGALLFLVLTVKGVARQARVSGWKPIHYSLPFYLAVIILWNYPDTGNRFLVPFMFLIVAGAWIEVRNIFCLLQTKLFSRTSTRLEITIAVISSAIILFAGFVTILAYTGKDPGKLMALSEERANLLPAKQEAYRWLAAEDCCSPVLAYEDASAYVYSGRQAMRPLVFPTNAAYDRTRFDEALAHVMDVGEALHSEYWVFSEDDFGSDTRADAAAIWQCMGRLGPDIWPVVFKSSDGRVVIRSLRGSNYMSPCAKPQN